MVYSKCIGLFHAQQILTPLTQATHACSAQEVARSKASSDREKQPLPEPPLPPPPGEPDCTSDDDGGVDNNEARPTNGLYAQ